MRTFFVQLFLSFWAVTLGIFVASMIVSKDKEPVTPDTFHAALDDTSAKIVNDVLDGYQRQGCSSLREMQPTFTLINSSGEALCSNPISAEEQGLVERARNAQHGTSRRIGGQWVQVKAVVSADKKNWYLLQRTPNAHRPWFPYLPPTALPVSLIVTFFFAFLLTRPLRKLSQAFRAFSKGDLSVRLPVHKSPWIGIGGDDVRRLMIDFNQMADRIKDLIEAQKLLVRDISHELRSPLARLRLALEIAREESTEDLPSLDRMEAEADRVNELIGEMMTLSLMETKRQLDQEEDLSVVEILESLVPDMVFEASARGCIVHFATAGKIPAISGNRELLRRAFENVIRNAIRFTQVGTEVEIGVAGDWSESAIKQAVRIYISDHGPGVAEANLTHIFRAFYRTDHARRDATGGFGVGLSIAERAVELHGGRIRAANRDGGGLKVEIVLPRKL